jgi:hypothetical protein
MRRAISYASRTLVGPWLLLPAAGIEATTFALRGLPWRGDGMWTVDFFAITLFIVGPLCAGVAGLDAARLTRPGNIHLVLAVPGSWRPLVWAAAWCAGPVVALHLAVIAIAVVVGQVQQPSVGWMWMLAAALLQCAAVVWYAAVGSAVGRLAPPLLGGLLGAGAGFVLSYVVSEALTGQPTFRLLHIGGATVPRVGLAYNPGFLAGQAVTFALTSALLFLFSVRGFRGYKIPTMRGAVAVLAVVAAIVAGPFVFPASRTVAAGRPPDHCLDTAPQICIYREHRRFAPLVVPLVTRLVQAAREAGYPALVPRLVQEDSFTWHPSGAGVMRVSLSWDTFAQGRLTIEEVATSMLEPIHCPQLYGANIPPPEFDGRFFSVLATWLHLAGSELEHTPVEPRLLGPQEVAEILDGFSRCDLAGRG